NYAPAHLYLGDLFRRTRRYPEAITEEGKLLERSEKNVLAYRYLVLANLDKNDKKEAHNQLNKARTKIPDKNYILDLTEAVLLAAEGKRNEALKAMNPDTLKFAGSTFTVTLDVAEFYAELGDIPNALVWLNNAEKMGDWRAEWFEKNPRLQNVRNSKRYQQQ